MPFQHINPANGQAGKIHPVLESSEIADRLARSMAAFRDWRKVACADRAALLQQMAAVLGRNREQYARLMSEEMGKPVREARAEVDKCAWVCEYYAERGHEFLAPESIVSDAKKSLVSYQPLGPVLAIMPWNFPFWQVFRFAAPALMAGNVALLKHAPNVPGCSLALAAAFREAGFPADVFINLMIEVDTVPEVIRDPRVKAVTLTGSTRAGKAVAAEAGANLKKTVLELGGSDPYLILEDADIDLAVEACATSRLINSGQSCIGAKRFIVVESRREQFEEAFVARMGAAKTGDPLSEDTEVGPLAREDLRDNLHRQVSESIAAGATCLLGGRPMEGEGYFYPPTVLSDVRSGMPVYEEEVFGPVAAIIPATDEAEAIRIANDTVYGLGAAVFTRSLKRGEHIATELLEAGACFVNGFVRSDPRLPFGGIKESGYGRELSLHGIREFVNVKTVYLA